MKKGKLIAVIIAVMLIVLGSVISFCAFAAADFNLSKFNNFKYVTNTYDITDSFTDISVSTDNLDVNLIPSDNDKCKVVCKETDKMSHNVYVKNNSLVIEEESKLKWFENIHLGFSRENTKVDIYLPEFEYKDLTVNSSIGDINIPDNFYFDNVELLLATGDVLFEADSKNNLNVTNVTGDIIISNVKADTIDLSLTTGDLNVLNSNAYTRMQVSSTNGDINIDNCNTKFLWSESTNGDIDLNNCIAESDIGIENTNGDIELFECDADNLKFENTNGDITGVFLSDKVFFTESTNGDIEVPKTILGGRCEAKTVNGDIEFSILK